MLIFIISGSFQNESEIVKNYTQDIRTGLEPHVFDLYDYINKTAKAKSEENQKLSGNEKYGKELPLLINEIEEYIDSLLKDNENNIVLGKEIGCGIVPINPKDRFLRELNGRINCYVASKANKVVRVIAGIEQVIKE